MKVRDHLYIKHIGMVIFAMGLVNQVDAQISKGGQPYSFSGTISDSIDTRTMAALDVAALVAEDELEAAQDSPVPTGQSFRSGGGTRTPDTRIMIPLL